MTDIEVSAEKQNGWICNSTDEGPFATNSVYNILYLSFANKPSDICVNLHFELHTANANYDMCLHKPVWREVEASLTRTTTWVFSTGIRLNGGQLGANPFRQKHDNGDETARHRTEASEGSSMDAVAYSKRVGVEFHGKIGNKYFIN